VRKSSRDADPLGEAVDRLLAQLSGASSGPRNRWAPARNGRSARSPVVVGAARDDAAEPSAALELAGLWARAGLVLLLAVLMTQWPYPRECGVRLLAYTGAVVATLIAGAWVGVVSWRRRNGAVHLLALVLAFWGVVLAAETLLPRIGYAAESAAWSCGGPGN
jgi:hypothetical protein